MSQQIIPEALNWLTVAGLNINEKKIHTRAIVLTAVCVVVIALEVLQIAFHFDSVDTVAGVVEVFAPMYMGLIKILMVFNYLTKLSNLNNDIKNFWSTNKFTVELETKLEKIFNTGKTLLMLYRWFAIATTTMIIPLKPVFSGNGGFPIDIWQPVNLLVSPYYEITYFLESCAGYYISLVNIAIDSMYAAYIMHVIGQCMLLKQAFRTLPLKEVTNYQEETLCWNDMKSYIAYHNHILHVINEIQTSHSFTFLSIVGTGTLTVCIDLYSVALDSGSLDIIRVVKYTFQCSFFIFLLFVYCFAGNQLTSHCSEVSDAIYDSAWYYQPLPRVRRGVILVIQKAQKEIKLNAGGLVTLDLVNFIKMLRLAFSVFTLIRAQAEKGNQITT